MTDLLHIKLEGGKYTLIQRANGGLEALRYGGPWRDLSGDNLVLSLGLRVAALEETLQGLRVAATNIIDDYSCAIDALDHEDEAEDSRELLNDLLNALERTRRTI